MAATPALEATVVWLTAPRRLELRRELLDESGLGPHELLCETLVTAISPGTELAAYRGLPPLSGGRGYPRLQGYCNVARVLAAGSAVTGLVAGDRILSFTSHRSHFRLAADDVLLRLDPAANADDLVCTYLYHLGYNAVLRSGVRAGSRVTVIGLGVLGLTSVALAAIAGATVTAVSEHETSRRLAAELGAGRVVTRDAMAEGQLQGPQADADVVISTSNSWADWRLALQLAAPLGTIACLGFPGRGEPPPAESPLDSRYFYVKQITIMAVGMSPERPDSRGFVRFHERRNLAFLAGLIAGGRLAPGQLRSGEYSALQIESAYHALESRTGSPLTFLLRWAT